MNCACVREWEADRALNSFKALDPMLLSGGEFFFHLLWP